MPEIPALPRVPPIGEAPGSSPGVSFGIDPIPLRAAFGQDEANHDTMRFSVDNDGLVWVPLEAVDPLIARGGFALARTADEVISAGTLKLHHDDAVGCSFAGQQYLTDQNGDVTVPAEAAYELSAHGFVAVLSEATLGIGNVKSTNNRSRKVEP